MEELRSFAEIILSFASVVVAALTIDKDSPDFNSRNAPGRRDKNRTPKSSQNLCKLNNHNLVSVSVRESIAIEVSPLL